MPTQPWLRHAARHVQGTARLYVREHLVDLGWANDEPTDTNTSDLPFGPDQATLVTIRDTAAFDSTGKLLEGVKSGLLAITVGDEPDSEMEELGGPLASQEYPLFFDVFQNTEATTLALASDIRDILKARLVGTRRVIPLLNMANQKAWAGWTIEFDDVIRQAPDHRFALPWQVVKATATVYFPEVSY